MTDEPMTVDSHAHIASMAGAGRARRGMAMTYRIERDVALMREGGPPGDSELVAVVVNGDEHLAERIRDLLNQHPPTHNWHDGDCSTTHCYRYTCTPHPATDDAEDT
ncbi:hypothetical protein FHR83_006682 [Actinoplanes campanulatus]|uniref:Uncharacterized protein n=1 Tax=Actinoplanes campanulatus TaxID=113559 RepID=A0A7W5AMS9_9ACTN|nr:hypothetical protein [Actinoplanes campanulatus]MBB3098976.1 hypothetical protein [Actinoplanes campanulatus]GGN39604.1 hypothetical protein GCM10010109_67740 [Actinoplanes campanulatus]